MRALFNMGTPRGLQQFARDLARVVSSLYIARLTMTALKTVPQSALIIHHAPIKKISPKTSLANKLPAIMKTVRIPTG